VTPKKNYEKILEELKRRRIARNGDKIIFDRGYYSYKNYVLGISKFKKPHNHRNKFRGIPFLIASPL